MTRRKPSDPACAKPKLGTCTRRVLYPGLFLALTSCSLAPSYHRPTVEVPAAYKAGSDLWTTATPADMDDRGHWWTQFGDTTLNHLESQLDANSPSLAIALARFDQASAFENEIRSSLFPHLLAEGSPTNNRQSNNRPLRGAGQPNEYDANSADLSLSYELDLWGRIRNEVAASKAEAQAADADLVSAKLSLQAQLADLYIDLRGDDIQLAILDDSLKAYRQGLSLTENRMIGGIDSGLSVARAKNLLADAMAQADEVAAQRALTEHAIASLVGAPAPTFSLPAAHVALKLPHIPPGIPSTLLERRPDIAAAERRTFAANADIGVARAAYFPSISLSAMFGWQNTAQDSLLAYGNRMWALGPAAALSLFDGGLRHARESEARARLDEASAAYRQTVLNAFQQVEDNLSLLDHLSREANDEDDAATAAQQAQQIATNRYTEGVVNYLDVVTAQTSYLQARRNTEQVRIRRLQASVHLIRALGGDWSVTQVSGHSTLPNRGPGTDHP